MVGFENLERGFLRPVSFCQPRNFIFKDIRKAFDENERQNIILEFRRIFFTANPACSIPEHLLHGFGGKHSALSRASLSPMRSFNFFGPKSELTLTNFLE